MRKLVEATFVSLDGVIEAPERWAMPFFGGAKDHFLAELNHLMHFCWVAPRTKDLL
jgi:hypothetical protein